MNQESLVNKIFKWIYYSGIWIHIIVNPFHWRFDWEVIKPDDLNPNMYKLDFQLLFLRVLFVFDDGSW